MSYVELSCRTHYSFLTGASYPHEYMERAEELGLAGIAITDDHGLYAIPKAYHAKKKFLKLKLLVGGVLHIKDHPPITLIAPDLSSYQTLSLLFTIAHQDKEKGVCLITKEELRRTLIDSKHRLIALLENDCRQDFPLLKMLFPTRLFIKLSHFLDGLDEKRDSEAAYIEKTHQIPAVATNDVHYHRQEQALLQDIMTSIRHGLTLQECGYRLFSNHERFLKGPKNMLALFPNRPDVIERTLEIADLCHFCPSELTYTYPSEWIPHGETAMSYLHKLVQRQTKTRYPKGIPRKVQVQLDHEMNLIEELKFADYFLTIYEIVDFAKSRKILCQGRGSAANSVVCYILGITAIDPVRMDLLFERFISSERGEPPDIDVDFEHDRREEVIQHIYKKYGRDRAAMVSAVVTYRHKSALREVAKVMGLPVGTLSARRIERDIDKLANGDERLKKRILESADKLHGFPRHLSIHSGGFTLSAQPISQIAPVEPARMENRTIIQWDKYDLDYLGLLKVDILGLGMLSAIRRSLEYTGMQLSDIPAEDKATYEMICRAETVGTFQIESRAQMSMLGRLQPKNFYDLVIEIAIVRPGPIVGKMVHPYLKRRNGEEKVEYHHPLVEKTLKKTLGILLFQEQVMKLAIDLAGFTPGQADRLRRVIAAWRSHGSVHEMGLKLMNGLLKSGLPKHFAKQVFEQIQGFAMYGFPESHSASFALIAYASCYLKRHHPAAFLCAMLNSQPLGFYAPHTLIDEAKRNDVEVLAIDLMASTYESTFFPEKTVRLGFHMFRGLSEKEWQQIKKERERRPFSDLFDFLSRVSLKPQVFCRMAMAKSFDEFNLSPRAALWQYFKHLYLYASKEKQQLSLFAGKKENPQKDPFLALSEFETITEEYKAYRASLTGHPMQAIRKLKKLPPLKCVEAKNKPAGSFLHVSGLTIVKQRPHTAKGMMFATLEDETGFLDIAITPDIFEKYKDIIIHHCFFRFKGVLQKVDFATSLLVKQLSPIFADDELEQQNDLRPRVYFR